MGRGVLTSLSLSIVSVGGVGEKERSGDFLYFFLRTTRVNIHHVLIPHRTLAAIGTPLYAARETSDALLILSPTVAIIVACMFHDTWRRTMPLATCQRIRLYCMLYVAYPTCDVGYSLDPMHRALAPARFGLKRIPVHGSLLRLQQPGSVTSA